MNKQIRRYEDIKDDIINAVDTLTRPVAQTLSPMGGNVILEQSPGRYITTNDGVTIADSIEVEDPFQNSIISIMKQSALETNDGAGDGTSTTIILSSILIKEGLKLIENGWNQMDLAREYKKFADEATKQLGKLSKEIKDDKDKLSIATISSNNDLTIAKDVVKIVNTAGQNGMIFLEPGNTTDTEIVEDTGFVIESGLFHPEIANRQDGTAQYTDVPVLITDKSLYYAQEAETILSTCLQNGYKEVVVVAKNFIGEALPFFVANHKKGVIRVLLVKDPNVEQNKGVGLTDLSVYLKGQVISESSGSIVDNLKIDNFVMAKRVFADRNKTLIVRDSREKNTALTERVKSIEKDIDKLGDSEGKKLKELKRRLASLTNGIVTVRIGGNTPIEINERKFRYEDAINALRAALRDGYLVGGGLSIFTAIKKIGLKGDIGKVARKLAEANIRQIAENCGINGDIILDNIAQMANDDVGYNALTGKYSNLLEDGVLDPYKVTEMAINNAVSSANAVISSRYIITNDKKDDKENE